MNRIFVLGEMVFMESCGEYGEYGYNPP